MHIIWIEMKTLDILEDIFTNFHQITRSRSQYNQKSIFPIFHFFNCGFEHFWHHFSL
eukprot:UN21246